MDKVIRPIAILNLVGELSAELTEYFSSRKVLVVDPTLDKEEKDWTHILVKNVQDLTLINKTYDLINKDCHIISLSQVDDLQNFTVNNGNLILDEVWFKTEIGVFILDKYFQGCAGITLGDNYPTFKEQGAFNISNPFNTGEYLDRMAQVAFEDGAPALTVKTFFDHLLMYVAGLKQKGKAGLPFEVTYGVFNDIFAVQVHFFSGSLDIMDVSTCLSSKISKKAEEYFLNIAVQSTDFFDFSHLPEVNKVVITGLWAKGERINFENRGLMFTSLIGGESLARYNNETVASSFSHSSPLQDQSEKIIIPERLGKEEEHIEVVHGDDERRDEVTIIKGQKELKELVQVVKGKFEEEKSIIRLSSSKLDVQEAAYRIAATVDHSAKESNLKIRSLGDKLPEAIKLGLSNFAKKIDKSVEDLSDLDLDAFQLEKLPEIIQQEIINDIHSDDATTIITGQETSDEPVILKGSEELAELITVIKGKFEDDKEIIRIDGFKLDVDKTAFRIAATVDESTQEKNLKVRSLGQKLPATIKTGLFDYAKFLNKSVEDLDNKDLDDFQVLRLPDIIRNGLINQKLLASKMPLVSSSEVSPDAKVLENKLMKASTENERLKKENKNLYSEVRILKESRAQMADVQRKSSLATNEIMLSSAVVDQDEELRKQFQTKLADQKNLTEIESKKLSELLERETKLVKEAREEGMKLKKLQIESLQKENFFAQEIEKNQRTVKAKDSLLIKTKDTFSKMVEMKDLELSSLKNKIDQLSKALATGPSQNQGIMLKELERQNLNLNKQLEVYKNKISSLASNMQSKSDDSVSKEELRKLQIQNAQMTNQLANSKRELLKLTEKTMQDSALVNSLKQDKLKLEQAIKANAAETSQNKEGAAPSLGQTDHSLKRLQAHNQILENQLRDSSQKISILEGKFLEAQKMQRPIANSDDSSKVKIGQLENSVKKLTQDLVDSRGQLGEMKKETNKLRQEKTALQNQLDRMRKEAEKAKAAQPKKPGSGGKAA